MGGVCAPECEDVFEAEESGAEAEGEEAEGAASLRRNSTHILENDWVRRNQGGLVTNWHEGPVNLWQAYLVVRLPSIRNPRLARYASPRNRRRRNIIPRHPHPRPAPLQSRPLPLIPVPPQYTRQQS